MPLHHPPRRSLGGASPRAVTAAVPAAVLVAVFGIGALGACGAEPSGAPASTPLGSPLTTGIMTTTPDSTPTYPTASSTGPSAPSPPSSQTAETSPTAPTPPTTPTPPLSTVPLPTRPPTGRVTVGPSDNFKPRTVTGSAIRGVDGCVQLTSGSITWHLTGPSAEAALAHSTVTVTGLPGQGLRRDCGQPQLAVSKVVPVP